MFLLLGVVITTHKLFLNVPVQFAIETFNRPIMNDIGENYKNIPKMIIPTPF